MGLFRNRRSSKLGLISDLLLVATAAGRLVQQRRSGTGAAKASVGAETVLAAGAGLRLGRRWLRRRKSRKAALTLDAG